MKKTILYHFKQDMTLLKVSQKPPVHAANLVANNAHPIYGVYVIVASALHVMDDQSLLQQTEVSHIIFISCYPFMICS